MRHRHPDSVALPPVLHSAPASLATVPRLLRSRLFPCRRTAFRLSDATS